MRISIPKIISTVSEFYGVPPNKLQRKTRKAKFVKPRQIAMYLLREELNRSYPYIGRLFGSRDHTTVIYAHKKISEAIQNSSELRSEIEQIENILHNGKLGKNQITKNKIDFK